MLGLVIPHLVLMIILMRDIENVSSLTSIALSGTTVCEGKLLEGTNPVRQQSGKQFWLAKMVN